MMGRTLDEVMSTLPEERRERIDVRFQELKDEVEGLGELRGMAGKAQADVASALKIKQPSVSKIEKQADLYLSTLRSYVEAVGGQLDLVVRLPSHPPLHLRHLGDVSSGGPSPVTKRGTRTASGTSGKKASARI